MPRCIPGDWYPGAIPDNTAVHERAWIETSQSFEPFLGRLPLGLDVGEGSTIYGGSLLDVGRRGRVRVGSYCMLNGTLIVCDQSVEIGDYALISWNVVIMDTYRTGLDVASRREALRTAAARPGRRLEGGGDPRPIRLGANVWVGFESCILPGVTIGEGAIVGARSVVASDVPAFCVAAGNPARVIRTLEQGARP